MRNQILRSFFCLVLGGALFGCHIKRSGDASGSFSTTGASDNSEKVKFKVYFGDFEKDLKNLIMSEGGKVDSTSAVAGASLNLISNGQDPISDINQMAPVPVSPDLKWPMPPRSIMNNDAGIEHAFTSQVGFEGSFESVIKVAAVDSLTITSRVVKQLFLIKNTPNNTDPMTERKEVPLPGGGARMEVRPYVKDGYDYVGLCTYTLVSETTNRLLGSITMSGNGFTAMKDFTDRVKLTLYTSYFKVTEKDTVRGLIDRCSASYSEDVKKELRRNLGRLLEGTFNYNASAPKSNESVFVNSSLFGPKVERIYLKGKHWNSLKAAITTKAGNIVTVDGKFEHSIRAQNDDIVNYHCEMDGINPIKSSVNFRQRSAIYNYKAAARDIVNMVCHDAYVDFNGLP
ncbi:MAG: hypothetical protein HQK54_16505, partial [Oligoflexales bacterium]|nr:hypothetical protein [Oligoflexales bacterium]